MENTIISAPHIQEAIRLAKSGKITAFSETEMPALAPNLSFLYVI